MKKKILVVDDEKEPLEIIAKKISENNYFAFTASSGKDAVSICKKEKPDLVILDIAMPDIDGYRIAETIRKEKPLKNIPIIFMSGKDLEHKGVANRLSCLGLCDYITKPFTIQELFSKIKETIK